MRPQELLNALHVAEKLKCATRHCDTSSGRRESVAEHCWRAALMAYFMKDEFPGADLEKVMTMCLIHDLGEAFTGDIPSFDKTGADEKREEALLDQWVQSLPEPYCTEMAALYAEMAERETVEARLFKAIDGLEAVLQHNESDIASWLPLEYELNQTYAADKAAFSPYLMEVRALLKEDTLKKIKSSL